MPNTIFQNTLCSLAAVPTPAYPLITDCAIWPAPQPIYDSPPLTIPIDVPFDVPCPTFNANATMQLSMVPGAPLTPSVNVTVTASPSSLSCGDTFDFDFSIPLQTLHCPGLVVGTNVVTSPTLLKPGVTVTGNRLTGSHSQCAFDFLFDFQLPAPPAAICPTIKGEAAASVTFAPTPSAEVTITRHSSPGSCVAIFDFAFALPSPPCPTVTAAATIEYVKSSISAKPPAVTLITTQTTTGGACTLGLDFNFELPLPPTQCPGIAATSKTTYTSLTSIPALYVTAVRKVAGTTFSSITSKGHKIIGTVPTGACDYMLDFDLSLPISYGQAAGPGGGGGGGSSSSSSSSSGQGGSGNCLCCDCFNCITLSQATVGGCSAAPNGAPYQYILNSGPSVFSDSNGTSELTTFTYGVGVCVGSSSSSSDTTSGSGCSWFTCPTSICQPSSSSSSSSSSSGNCGIYQLRMDLSLDSDGFTVAKIYIVFMSGNDWLGIGS